MIVVQGTDVPVEVRVLQRPEQSVIKKMLIQVYSRNYSLQIQRK